jgi:hypothetical protein
MTIVESDGVYYVLKEYPGDGYNAIYSASTRGEAEAWVRDREARDAYDHTEFASRLKNKSSIAIAAAASAQSDDEARRSLARMGKLSRLLAEALQARAVPGSGHSFMRISFDEGAKMMREYRDAEKQGAHRDFAFQPLSAYHHKLVQTDGDGRVIRKIRDIFQNEFGVWTNRDGVSYILIFRDQGPDDVGEKYHQVPRGGGECA